MKPFNLDTVLDYRKRLEDIAIHRLAEAKRQEKIIQQKLDEDRRNLAALIKEIEQLQNETISILDLINFENRILFLKKNIHSVKTKLHEKSENRNKMQENLIEKSKNRQIMASLKDQQNRAWKKYLDKKEVAMLDEIATIRHDAGI
ncbi:MAG: flagellar export protein FliJ [Desulfobulbaceae bacterium S3730MH12]|nr:MAG: flagellar export protein FliJ [Desulfobulbaceae bacterium S5133MH15]OEU56043.1 MAG: flagellar export protein FliJ [Desulfobulbaceae bacterium S3730MH12]